MEPHEVQGLRLARESGRAAHLGRGRLAGGGATTRPSKLAFQGVLEAFERLKVAAKGAKNVAVSCLRWLKMCVFEARRARSAKASTALGGIAAMALASRPDVQFLADLPFRRRFSLANGRYRSRLGPVLQAKSM